MANRHRYISCLLSLAALCSFADCLMPDGSDVRHKSAALYSVRVGLNSSQLLHRVERGTSGSRLTYEERVEFLTVHNDFRRNVNPTSSDMQFMIWHEELAEMAQEWADNCVWKHGQPERDPKPFQHIGQNLYVTTAATVSGTKATTSWYNEVDFYDYATASCQDDKVCGHYTQVVWANSDNLGCAIAECQQMTGISMTNAKYVVCNYGPGGNYVGSKPYAEGSKCSSCELDMICDDGLCAVNPKCGSKQCENGGILDNNCECDCPEGYNGATCDISSGARRPDNAMTNLLDFIVFITVSIMLPL